MRLLPARRQARWRRSRAPATMMYTQHGSGAIRSGVAWSAPRRLVIVYQRQRLGHLLEIAGRTAGGARLCACVHVRGDACGRRLAAVGMLRELEVRLEVRF